MKQNICFINRKKLYNYITTMIEKDIKLKIMKDWEIFVYKIYFLHVICDFYFFYVKNILSSSYIMYTNVYIYITLKKYIKKNICLGNV